MKEYDDSVRAALEPVAAIADHYADQEYDSFCVLSDFDILGPKLTLGMFRKARSVLATLSRGEAAEPIPMILHCPKCGLQHIDAPEHALAWTGGAVPEPSHDEVTWENPPHRSHLCHGCGHIWRPADVPTEGVAEIKTRGKNDSPTHHHEAGGAPGREEIEQAINEHVRFRPPSRFFPGGELVDVDKAADAILALWAKPDQQGREQVIGELCEALEGVIAVADRKTVEFDKARAALAKARSAQ